jgi:hypothetical protein
LAVGAVVVAAALVSTGPTGAQTTKGTTTGTTTTASSTPAVSQSALFEQFLMEEMIAFAFEDFMAMGGGTPDQFLTFLEATLGGLVEPELAAAANGQTVSFPASDDPDLAFEEFLMEFFVAQAQADFKAAGGGTNAQFQAFLTNALITAGAPQLASVAKQVAAADAALAAASATTSTTSTTGSTTTTGTTTGTKTTTGTGTKTTPGG